MTDALLLLAFQQERFRVFDEFFDADQEADRLGAVYDAMVVGEREVHHGTDRNLAFDDDGALLDLVHPSIATWGKVRMGVETSEPKMPPLVMVKVPPRRSSSVNTRGLLWPGRLCPVRSPRSSCGRRRG